MCSDCFPSRNCCSSSKTCLGSYSVFGFCPSNLAARPLSLFPVSLRFGILCAFNTTLPKASVVSSRTTLPQFVVGGYKVNLTNQAILRMMKSTSHFNTSVLWPGQLQLNVLNSLRIHLVMGNIMKIGV